ncbi:hypothetical protein N4P33_15245 [Streptomyces sp. 15-116A]|uniref:hypothetical protein n=1 Tax=Streptomyces sp. 15-116A TaxID=2259035 RepID=UPI0021B2B005|nr:hypothetical protein [Streptomyces sp. 15-116A]MCT7353522.1 hypothetical protein [Streptomyces sp. 15-116A]
MAHLRTVVWGPAEFVGLPPLRLVGKGLLAACAGTAAIVGTALLGAWYGKPALASAEAALGCAAVLVLYLCLIRAGRALIGTVAVLAAGLALQAPQSAAGVVLAERGRVESAVVTSVETGRAAAGPGRYLCTVTGPDGVPLEARIWRGCGPAVQPGDALAVVHDPKGGVAPRGVDGTVSRTRPLRDLGGWAAALVTASAVAVVRAHRLSDAGTTARHPVR